MKKIFYHDRVLKELERFSEVALQRALRQIRRLQKGLDPTDWRPMPQIGKGVREIRVHAENEYRVIYVGKFGDAVHVLYAFSKKSARTPKQAIETARQRLAELTKEVKGA